MTDINMKLMTITPELATQFLNKNVNNRRYREMIAQKYADAIKSGEWQTNGETIKIAKDGRLLDGQHRLRAVVLANKSIQAYVVSELEDEVFDTIDVGITRSPADALDVYTQGRLKNPIIVASALKLMNSFDNENRQYKIIRGHEFPLSHTKLIELLKNTPEIEENYDFVMSLSNAVKMIPCSIVLGMYTAMRKIDEDQADRFWMSFNSLANLSERSPVKALHQRLVSFMLQNQGRKPRRYTMVGFIVKAWNFRRSNRGIGRIDGYRNLEDIKLK